MRRGHRQWPRWPGRCRRDSGHSEDEDEAAVVVEGASVAMSVETAITAKSDIGLNSSACGVHACRTRVFGVCGGS